jgi:hypothetical protein
MASQFLFEVEVLQEISLSLPNNCDLDWSMQSFEGVKTLKDSANHWLFIFANRLIAHCFLRL